MKKCKGCGEIIQNEDSNKLGYSPNLDFDYCQRCFRLVHYGDSSKVNFKKTSNDKIVELYKKYNDSLYIVIVDIFDFLIADIDNYISNINHDFVLIVNKIDLLPKNYTNNKIDNIISQILKKINNQNMKDCLITHKEDPYFNELFFETINKYDTNNLLFIGRTNAGKSTIINKLINSNTFTTSIYSGTSTNVNVVDYNNYRLIDTPGIIDFDNIINHIDKSKVKYLVNKKMIKERMYQFYQDEVYSIEGLCAFSLKANEPCFISFVIPNELNIHRTKKANFDNYLSKNKNSFSISLLPFSNKLFKVDGDALFVIKGIGFIRIKGSMNVDVLINDKIEVYKKEDILDANW